MTKREMPTALYAVAGAGDLAYRRLRRLPEAASRTFRAASVAADNLRERVNAGDSRLNRQRLAADLAKLRESAQRGATTFLSSAEAVQEKATARYRELVAHGEQVVAARNQAKEPQVVAPAEIAQAEVAQAEAEPAEVAQAEAPADPRPESAA